MPHWECTSSPGMGMCLTENVHSLYRVYIEDCPVLRSTEFLWVIKIWLLELLILCL